MHHDDEPKEAKRAAHTVLQARMRLGQGHSRFYREVKDGRLRTFKVGRRTYISEAAIQDYIRDREAEQETAEMAAKRERASQEARARRTSSRRTA